MYEDDSIKFTSSTRYSLPVHIHSPSSVVEGVWPHSREGGAVVRTHDTMRQGKPNLRILWEEGKGLFYNNYTFLPKRRAC